MDHINLLLNIIIGISDHKKDEKQKAYRNQKKQKKIRITKNLQGVIDLLPGLLKVRIAILNCLAVP